jgi:hypothetical protein
MLCLWRSPAPARDRSPIAYKNTVIIPVGGRGQAVMAFNQNEGSVAWKKQDFDSSPSSSLLVSVDVAPLSPRQSN